LGGVLQLIFNLLLRVTLTKDGCSIVKTSVQISLPSWISGETISPNGYDTDSKKMALAVNLSRRNVEQGTGGPFGAAVFTADGNLVSVGVNCVVAQRSSVMHAEIAAIMLAQRMLGMSRLEKTAHNKYVLATSAQPCAMCLGAVVWSGASALLFGARRADVESITGFDEGPLPLQWERALSSRGIRVRGGILRARASGVLRAYKELGGVLY
jgi:tRNA(Arg) A34 adenosine deaminase TadA